MRLGRAVNGLLPEASVFRLATKALLVGIVIALLAAAPAWATDFHGQVVFGGLPVPGAQATVTATQGDKTVTAVTDDQGLFDFTDLADGAWTITITMTGFAPIKEPITVAPNSPIPVFELKLQTLAEIRDEDKPVKVEPGAAPAATAAATSPAANASAKGNTAANGKGKNGSANQAQTAGNNAPPEAPPAQEASSAPSPDGFLINGSVNNAATSQFSLNQAFGNARNSRSLYNAQFALNFSSSALNANSHSLLAPPPTKPNFNNYTAQFQFGGPLKIPHLLPLYRAPNFYIAYGRSDNTSVNIPPALMPTPDLIGGNLGALTDITGQVVYVPASGLSPACSGALSTLSSGAGLAFPSNGQGQYIPSPCISPIAQNILNKLYPVVPSGTPIVSGYNYQVPLSTDSHSDFGRVNLAKGFGNKNNLNGTYSLQSTRESNPNLFGFVDKQANLGQSMNVSWYHR